MQRAAFHDVGAVSEGKEQGSSGDGAACHEVIDVSQVKSYT
jgi:hypothetical protein